VRSAWRPTRRCGPGWRVGLGRAGDDAGDQPDVDRFAFQRPDTGLVDRVGPELLDQPEEPVDLAHLGPWQRDVEQRRGVGPDRGSVAGGHRLELVEVAHRVDGDLRRQVRLVGGSAARGLFGVDLDHLPAEEDLDEAAVDADGDALADQRPRDRIQRLGDLDVMVTMHLRDRPSRGVVHLGRCREQQVRFLEREHLGRAGTDGAVDPHAGLDPTPVERTSLRVGEVGELLAGEERVAHVGDGPLHAWLGRSRQLHPMQRMALELCG
jgi:hypothetical protein